MNIGLFHIPEGLPFPRTHAEKRHHLRAFSRSIDLDLRFARRQKSTLSYCDGLHGKAVVIEKMGTRYYPIAETIFFTLHECAHWMDANNGLFRDFYPRWGYKHAIYPRKRDILRIGVRAEQHADWLANRIMWIMYGQGFVERSVYAEVDSAREELIEHYRLE